MIFCGKESEAQLQEYCKSLTITTEGGLSNKHVVLVTALIRDTNNTLVTITRIMRPECGHCNTEQKKRRTSASENLYHSPVAAEDL